MKSEMNLLCDDDSSHEGPPSKRQKTAEIDSDDFENVSSVQDPSLLKFFLHDFKKLTLPIALELGEESRDLERKLSNS